MDDRKSAGSPRKWKYSKEGLPIVLKFDRKCEDYVWEYGSIDMNICGCCRWFCKIEGTARTYRCICENRRKVQ